MAVAVASAFHPNLAGCGLALSLLQKKNIYYFQVICPKKWLAVLKRFNLSVRSFDEASSQFGAKSEMSIHTTDFTVRFPVQPTITAHRR